MNEIEKAIETLKSIYEDYLSSEDDKVDLRPYDESIQDITIMLEQALQEKAERENPKQAKWLTWEEQFPNKKLPKQNGLGVFCTSCGLHSDNVYNFCPNCGANMKEEK